MQEVRAGAEDWGSGESIGVKVMEAKLSREETLRRLKAQREVILNEVAKMQLIAPLKPYHGRQNLNDNEIERLRQFGTVLETIESAIFYLEESKSPSPGAEKETVRA